MTRKGSILIGLSFILLFSYVGWAIVAESRMTLSLESLDVEDVADLGYAFLTVSTGYCLFFFLVKNLLWFFKQKNRLLKWVWVLLIAILMVYLWELFLGYLYFSLYHHVPLFATTFFYEDTLIMVLGFLIISAIALVKHELINSPPVPNANKLKVHQGKDVFYIEENQVAVVISRHKNTYVHTKEGKVYISDLPLKEIDEMLDHSDFFRLNRQIIANREAIVGYRSLPYQKLQVELKIVDDPLQFVNVSKYQSASFKSWLNKAVHSAK